MSAPLPLRLVLAVLALLSLAGAATAQQIAEPRRPFGKVLEEWSGELDQVTREIAVPDPTQRRIRDLRQRVRAVVDDATRVRGLAARDLAQAQRLLDVLGPAPGAEGSGPETDAVTQQRAALQDDRTFFAGRLTQVDLVLARSDALLERLDGLERGHLENELLTRHPPVYLWSTWVDAARDGLALLRNLGSAGASFAVGLVSFDGSPAGELWRLGVLLVALVGSWKLRRFVLGRYGHRDDASPTFARRLRGAIAEALGRAIVPTALLFAILLPALTRVAPPEPFRTLMVALLAAAAMVTLTTGFSWASLAPRRPAWRVAPFDDRAALLLHGRLRQAVLGYGVMLVLLMVVNADEPSSPIESVISAVGTVVLSALVLRLMSRAIWHGEPDAPPEAGDGREEDDVATGRWAWTMLQLAIAAVLVASPAAAFLGYANLAGWLHANLALTGFGAAFLFLLRGLVRELGALLLEDASGIGRRFRDSLGISPDLGRAMHLWLGLLLDVALAAIGVVLLMLIWNVPLSLVERWAGMLLRGVTIGSFTVSLGDVALAILAFVALIGLTRLFQSFLAARVLNQMSVDTGLKHSVRSGVGYLGFSVAVIAAIGVLGVDLTSITLILSALSVGIGFGLRNLINDFVCGLVLLAERPIKVGDWIVVGDEQGYVSRIKTRATEIQTFQRAAVIVPNSKILEASLKNWTHRDRYVRVEVRIHTLPSADPKAVESLLLAIAADNAHVMRWPAPYVLLTDIVPGALHFELRAYLNNVDYFLSVPTQIRMEILRRFAESGIEIPFGQQDLHLRTVPATAADGAPADAAPGIRLARSAPAP